METVGGLPAPGAIGAGSDWRERSAAAARWIDSRTVESEPAERMPGIEEAACRGNGNGWRPAGARSDRGRLRLAQAIRRRGAPDRFENG